MTTARGSDFNIHGMQWHQREATWSQADINPSLGVRVQMWDRSAGPSQDGGTWFCRTCELGQKGLSLVDIGAKFSLPYLLCRADFELWWNFVLLCIFPSVLNNLVQQEGQSTFLHIVLVLFFPSSFLHSLFLPFSTFCIFLSIPFPIFHSILILFLHLYPHVYILLFFYVPSSLPSFLLYFFLCLGKCVWEIWLLKKPK
jgi:hypothetical protein